MVQAWGPSFFSPPRGETASFLDAREWAARDALYQIDRLKKIRFSRNQYLECFLYRIETTLIL